MKILFLAFNPSSSERLALDEEARSIEEKIRRAKWSHAVELRTRWAVRAGDLQQAFLDVEPTVVHFSGHGMGFEGLLLHGEGRVSEALVSSRALCDLFRAFPGNVRLVVLNACFSEEQATAIVEEIDFVVGMSGEIDDEAAGVFAAALYRGLVSGGTMQTAFDLGLSELSLLGCEEFQQIPRLYVRPGVEAGRSILVQTFDSSTAATSSTERVDAVLVHDPSDEQMAKAIGGRLEDEAGLRVWLEDWNGIPGESVYEALGRALAATECCVILQGCGGPGPWENSEVRSAIEKRTSRARLRVLPVLLHEAERPSLESLLPAFLRRLRWVSWGSDWKDQAAFHQLRCGILGISPGRFDDPASLTTEEDEVETCPYRGLEVFRPEDHQFFFGREAQVERLQDHLSKHRFLAVIGPSGSGKSSVVQAGLLPRLGEATSFQVFTPGERPLEELAVALHRAFPGSGELATEMLKGRLEASEEGLHLMIRELSGAAGFERFVLVVDQFEELFTLTRDPDEAERFRANLLTAVDRSGPTSVILTFRSDFLGHCATHPDLNTFVQEHLFQLGPLSPEEFRSAIVEPAHRVGLRLEDELVEEILADLESVPSELPLLEHALLELFQRREGAEIRLKSYREIGRIAGALTQRAEVQFEKLNPTEQETLRKMFVFCLVKVGDGTEDTRRRASREEVLAVGEDPAVAESLLQVWTNTRLLATSTDEDRKIQLVDVAHEALIRRWARLREWLEEDRETSRQVEVLRRGAKDWVEHDRHEDYLPGGARLAQARELLASHGDDLTGLEEQFVAAARAKAQRNLRRIGAITLAALVVAVSLVSQLAKSRADAEENKNDALQQLSLAFLAQSRVEMDEGRYLEALHYVSEAVAGGYLEESRASHAIAAAQLQPRWALKHVLAHGERVNGASFDRSGKRVLTWSDDHTARLWDALTGKQIGQSFVHGGSVVGAVFGRGDKRVLTWSSDYSVRMWDLEKGRQIGSTMLHTSYVRGAVYSLDGSQVLTWSDDRTARLWDALTGAQVFPSLAHEDEVSGAAFSRDGSRVLTWTFYGEIKIWSASTGQQIGFTLSHEDRIYGSAFDKEGGRVLSWSNDGTVRIWEVITGKPVQTFALGNKPAQGAQFLGDESRVLTWSLNRTVRIWDVATGKQIGWEMLHRGSVLGAILDKDENRVLTWSSDKRVNLLNPKTGQLIVPSLSHGLPVVGAVFDQSESRVLTWSEDGKARLWKAATGQQLGPGLLHEGAVRGAMLDNTEERLLTWGEDNSVRLWKASAVPPSVFLRHRKGVVGVRFDKDEGRALTWSWDKTVRLWDMATGGQIGPSFEHEDVVWGAVFNHSESRILTWSRDKTVRQWDLATGEQIGPSLEHESGADGAVFDNEECNGPQFSDHLLS